MFATKGWAAGVLSFSCLLMSACDRPDNTTAVVADQHTTDISLSGFNGQIADSAYLKPRAEIFLETNDDALVSDVQRVLMDDSLIFIFDRSLAKISIFDIQGRHLRNVQNIGRGPNEYQQVVDIFLDREAKQLVLLCDRPYKLQYYDYSGRLLRQVPTKRLYLEGATTNDDLIYLRSYEPLNDEVQRFHIHILDKDGEIKARHLSIDNHSVSINIFPMWADFLNGGQAMTYFTRRFDNAIYQIDGIEVLMKYLIDFKEYNLPKALFSKKSDDILTGLQSQEYVYAIYSVVETDLYLLFQTNLGLFFLDKEEKDLQGFKTIGNVKFNCPLSNYFVVDSDGGKIIFLEDAARIIAVAGEMKKIGLEGTRLYNLADRLQATDNPVLFLYDLK